MKHLDKAAVKILDRLTPTCTETASVTGSTSPFVSEVILIEADPFFRIEPLSAQSKQQLTKKQAAK
jgi:hypothetical protein